tara:strand:- start:18535 stop:19245 length:711 start_codon:yes stop_codon:yes gene_type:complete
MKIFKTLLVLTVSFNFIGCTKDDNAIVHIPGNGITDIEGNKYSTVIIGDQEWMAENLNTSFFKNGDSIPSTGNSAQVLIYDDDPQNAEIYGKLYNFKAVTDTSGLCPCGWEVPRELDYAKLINYLGGYKEGLKKLKSKGNLYDGTGLWVKRTNDHLYAGTNLSGFHAIPGGMANKSQSVSNTFSNKDTLASFWAIPENVNNAITYQLITPQVEKLEIHGDLAKEEVFYSVRCIKSK